ncbi:hypothetical protein IWX78_002642 [Mycetocola sp. CAN_C7]|uniref:LmeA family phospholipid-binding protein n=1 Tax=Mycetocola sp. CAN_C7 TaxID=2787724 RepID=UPI0018C96765
MAAADEDGWTRLSQGAETEREPVRRSAGRRWITAFIVIVVAAVVVVGGAFLAESVARGFTQDAVAAAVQTNLPSNVEATVDVDIDGDWVLLQILSGRMDRVTISSDDARFDGIPVERVVVTASGVPIDLKTAVDSVDATATLDEPALNELLTLPGNDPQLVLGDGTAGYEDSTTVFGFDIGYLITAVLTPDGTDVLLTPQSAEVTSPVGSLDVSSILDRLVAEPVTICAADRLPEGVTLSDIEVADGFASLSLSANDFVLSGSSLRTTGECPAA